MPKNTISITTLRKNISKEARDFFIRHQTYLIIRRLAEQDDRHIGTFLDVLFEQLAREHLSEDEVEQIIAQGKQEEERRRQEAEARQPELLAKRQQKKQQKAVNE